MSGRRPRTASSSTSGWSIRATGPGRAVPIPSWPGPTSTSPSSRPPAAASSCGAWATSRTTRASSRTSRPTTSTSTASTRCPSSPRSSRPSARITKPDGWVGAQRRRSARGRRRAPGPGAGRAVLDRPRRRRSADDPAPRRGAAAGPTWSATAWLVEVQGRARDARSPRSARIPITIGGLARHNVANALAAAGGARGLGATIAQVRDGLLDFRPSAERSPGRLNLFRLGSAS